MIWRDIWYDEIEISNRRRKEAWYPLSYLFTIQKNTWVNALIPFWGLFTRILRLFFPLLWFQWWVGTSKTCFSFPSFSACFLLLYFLFEFFSYNIIWLYSLLFPRSSQMLYISTPTKLCVVSSLPKQKQNKNEKQTQ